jgi:serine/threonine protein phosphatase 1
MRTLAIGDIHGCHTALQTLFTYVNIAPADKIIFLGDYIDRGPASREVVETLLELSQKCSVVFIRGNHEVMILDARADPLQNCSWQSYGGVETLFSYGANYKEDWIARIPESHWKFFELTRKYYETGSDIFVHACLDAQLDLKDQSDDFLFWEPFNKIAPHQSGKRIVCGHTQQKNGIPANNGFAVCIDTGAAYGNWLTCLDTVSGKYWQANEKGETREGTLEHPKSNSSGT